MLSEKPWKGELRSSITKNRHGRVAICDADDHMVAECREPWNCRAEDVRDYIIEACNAYERQREALEKMVEFFLELEEGPAIPVFELARQALGDSQ